MKRAYPFVALAFGVAAGAPLSALPVFAANPTAIPEGRT